MFAVCIDSCSDHVSTVWLHGIRGVTRKCETLEPFPKPQPARLIHRTKHVSGTGGLDGKMADQFFPLPLPPTRREDALWGLEHRRYGAASLLG